MSIPVVRGGGGGGPPFTFLDIAGDAKGRRPCTATTGTISAAMNAWDPSNRGKNFDSRGLRNLPRRNIWELLDYARKSTRQQVFVAPFFGPQPCTFPRRFADSILYVWGRRFYMDFCRPPERGKHSSKWSGDSAISYCSPLRMPMNQKDWMFGVSPPTGSGVLVDEIMMWSQMGTRLLSGHRWQCAEDRVGGAD